MFTFVCLLVVVAGVCSLGVSAQPVDWLVNKVTDDVVVNENDQQFTLTNGLISRTFTTTPSLGTIDYRSITAERSILRTILPEGYITLDGTEYPIGGLYSNIPHSYLNTSDLLVLPMSFQYTQYTKGSPKALFNWKPGLRHSPSDVSWPPKGLTLTLQFKAPNEVKRASHSDIVVLVNYEMYVGVPIISKWLSVENTGETPVTVDKVVIEYLGTQKPYAPLSYSPNAQPWEHDINAATASWLYVEANVPHGASVNWGADPASSSSPGADEPVLTCTYGVGPGVVLSSTSLSYTKSSVSLNEFDTYRVLELVTDSYDRERVALSRHRLTRLLAPQTQENPIFFHGTDSSLAGFKLSIDQMAAVGFEMYIFSFGSGFVLENLDETNTDKIASDVSYAKSKGIEVGGYDLIDLDRGHGGYGGNVGDQWDVVSPTTGKLTVDACFASGWYDNISDLIFQFINKTGLSMLETDGPYGGAKCASRNHTHHSSANDSVYWQTKLQAKLYSDLRAMNVFINQPDNYFYWGGSKSAMGYNENQYSLPRWEDLSVSRQGMFDDTFHFLPTQGWMFVPLVDYHGGGAAAAFEPLSQNLLEYEWALAQYMGYGVAACYRGPRLYDSDKTMQMVKKWVDFYKTYRDILTSDIVHVRRPDMLDYDCILHVNPYITNRGLAMVFNPTQHAGMLVRNISLPLYYTGINSKALVMHEGAKPGVVMSVQRDYTVQVLVKMEPRSVTWFLIQSAD